MVGVPVIINHKDLNKDNADDERIGVVNSVWYDEKDGWYWCDGIIWDETAQNLITDKKWSVSCSYDVKTANDEGGSENNIKYDMEFLDGVFTHLALVDNPRYERANIVFNSKTVIENNNFNPNVKENEEMNVENWNEADHPRDEQGKFTEKGDVQKYLDEGWQATTYFKNGGTSRKDVGFKLYKGNVNAFGLDEGDIDISGEDFAEFTRQKKIRDKGHDYDIIKLKDDSGKEYYELKRNGKFLARDYDKFKIQEYINKRMDEQIEDYWKNKANNSKENEMALIDELKKLITKVENDKEGEQDMTVENEKVDKRKLIDEVGGILKGKVDDEIIRTIIGKLEKVAYEKSEADTADNEKEEDAENCKKVKNEDEKDEEEVKEVKEEVKEDVENKCKNSVDNSKTDYFAKLNEIYNSASSQMEPKTDYVSRADREQAAIDYFAR